MRLHRNFGLLNFEFKNSKLTTPNSQLVNSKSAQPIIQNSKFKTQNARSAQFKTQNSKFNTQNMFDFGIKDIIDIFLVALMLYYIYRLMKESRSLNVFIGIIVFVLVWLFVSQVLEMRLLGAILDKLVSVGVIGIIVLFQE